MIVWLASYPKSGNTLVRSMLAAYFFSKDGVYNFDLIKNIKQFPNITLFENLGIDIRNEKEVIKNYIKVQESFNNKNSVQFLKTHSYLFNFYDKYPFTNLNTSLGVVYIVRDPRNVVTSFAKFSNYSTEEAANAMINELHFGGNLAAEKNLGERSKVWTGTWNSNYNSWKSFKNQQRYLLIKYEDLINNSEITFLKILEFIFKINKSKFTVDQAKLNNVLKTTTFENMKNLEKEKGFIESKTNKKTGEKIPFFNFGPQNDWRQLLDPKIKDIIEKTFEKEMLELGYL
ncbi:sulfotransferase domain-containing protein [Candidatus Pelagibacter bacterium nBUS_30]|uniref:sulfotransferase domain-containing protein n=1 Tax=Candidatus Pelagibacter bacterium nBUS_30 TaxID=3374191 RepID=UPI003EBD6092